VTDPAAFTTTSGLQGLTWQAQGPTQTAQTWLVGNGTKVAKFDGNGPTAAWAKVKAELEAMATSITMTSP
jgi:hypothetical protein